MKQQSKGGRGLFREMAEHLRISSVLMSQIVNGNRQLGEDQAFELCRYLKLSENEAEYFLLLAHRERAHMHTYQKHLDEKINKMFLDANQPKNKVLPSDIVMSEKAKSHLASNIEYSLIRLACSLPSIRTADEIADRFQLPRQEVVQALEFLTENGLCVQTPEGYELGPDQGTYRK